MVYKHQPELIEKLKSASILWDFTNQTGRKIKNDGPDLVVDNYKRIKWLQIDISVANR